MVDSSITVSAYIMYKDSETVSSFDLGTVVLEPTGSNFSYFEINPNAKFYSRTFDVFLGYEDPDGNLSDFTLTFEYEGKNYDVALQAISDSQTAEFPSDIELDEETTYPYTFTYHDAELGEDVVFDSGSIQFTDLEKGSITELLWPKTANSKTREFTFGVDWDHKVTLGSRLTTLSLNYIDPDNRLSEFVLRNGRSDRRFVHYRYLLFLILRGPLCL